MIGLRLKLCLAAAALLALGACAGPAPVGGCILGASAASGGCALRIKP
jgi:hypothetical protein